MGSIIIGGTTTTVSDTLSGSPTDFTTFSIAGNPGGTINAGNVNTIIFTGLDTSSFTLTGRVNGFQVAEIVPEPVSGLLLALGVGTVCLRRRS